MHLGAMVGCICCIVHISRGTGEGGYPRGLLLVYYILFIYSLDRELLASCIQLTDSQLPERIPDC